MGRMNRTDRTARAGGDRPGRADRPGCADRPGRDDRASRADRASRPLPRRSFVRVAACSMAAAVALPVLAMTGCGQSEEAKEPTPGTATITLNFNAGTGYQWFCELDNDEVMEIVSQKTEDIAAEGIVGGPLKDTVALRAKAAGTTVLTCTLARSWEGSGTAAEVASYEFAVADDLSVTCTESTLSSGASEPVIG